MTQAHHLASTGQGSTLPPRETPGPDGDRCAIRCLDLNEVLHRAGEPKAEVYEVTAGVICLYRERPGLPPRIVDLVHPGGMIGLGFLDVHAHTARAVVPSTLKVVAAEEAARAGREQGNAAQRELIARRDEITADLPGDPLSRLARFLIAVSALNAREGRDATRIPDELACGVVAEWLRMDLPTLARQLVALRRRGLAAAEDDGALRLTDLEGLEALGGSGHGDPLRGLRDRDTDTAGLER